MNGNRESVLCFSLGAGRTLGRLRKGWVAVESKVILRHIATGVNGRQPERIVQPLEIPHNRGGSQAWVRIKIARWFWGGWRWTQGQAGKRDPPWRYSDRSGDIEVTTETGDQMIPGVGGNEGGGWGKEGNSLKDLNLTDFHILWGKEGGKGKGIRK